MYPINQSIFNYDCAIDHTLPRKESTSSTSLPRITVLTSNVDEDVSESLFGVVFVDIVNIVPTLSVYRKVLHER